METVIPPPETRSQLKDEAAAHIRGLIASGQVQSGELMRLAPLAERVGASVTPVREALLLLAQDGWVVQEPNRGFRVAPITRRDVSDDYWVHAQVAGELAARLARVIDEETLALLRRLDQQIRELRHRRQRSARGAQSRVPPRAQHCRRLAAPVVVRRSSIALRATPVLGHDPGLARAQPLWPREHRRGARRR